MSHKFKVGDIVGHVGAPALRGKIVQEINPHTYRILWDYYGHTYSGVSYLLPLISEINEQKLKKVLGV